MPLCPAALPGAGTQPGQVGALDEGTGSSQQTGTDTHCAQPWAVALMVSLGSTSHLLTAPIPAHSDPQSTPHLSCICGPFCPPALPHSLRGRLPLILQVSKRPLLRRRSPRCLLFSRSPVSFCGFASFRALGIVHDVIETIRLETKKEAKMSPCICSTLSPPVPGNVRVRRWCDCYFLREEVTLRRCIAETQQKRETSPCLPRGGGRKAEGWMRGAWLPHSEGRP